ncbi:hypothetical protein EPN95_02075 [Patescibacteria group bacterium]|nr:MAG: hypothetical protein EPN95_02075 [Patescibacteria group bacterium]
MTAPENKEQTAENSEKHTNRLRRGLAGAAFMAIGTVASFEAIELVTGALHGGEPLSPAVAGAIAIGANVSMGLTYMRSRGQKQSPH